MAYSTRSLEFSTVTKFSFVLGGVMISSIICPSCNSPRIPRVPENLVEGATSRATSTSLLGRLSCLETVSKEAKVRSVFLSQLVNVVFV